MIAGFAQRWHDIEPLLDRLFDVPDAERRDWLRQHCADATLRDLVEQALANAHGNEALERGMTNWLPAAADNAPDAPESLPAIAGYRVLRFISAGGMASVFEAERTLPGGPQTVALKLLRIDVHAPDERKRFLREQQLLARLQHPHIAQLLDAGFSPTGTPFLALEYVDGGDVVTHCAERHLDARARLALFVDVCTAVEHAHRSLIVHRDLKPSNVLVGADGCVKLVDFGIAKLLGTEGDATRTEARRLTRTYAAPEQIAGDPATTAIDVYALGVLLAELLGGQRPCRREERGTSNVIGFDDVALAQRLGVDLHAIVRAATRADPLRRYPSVAALRDDIERYRAGKPLHARADTLAYRLLMLAKRHALAAAMALTISVVLAGASLVSLHEARLARGAADEARAQVLVAEAETRRADAVKSFLEGLFDSASPGVKTSQTAEELLARGRERADRDFAMQPALRAEILALVGDLERRSGHADVALQPLEDAAALAKGQFGAADPRTLHAETLIAENADELGRARDAVIRLRTAVDAFDAGASHGSREEVKALAWLAGLDERIGQSAEAIDIGEKALALARSGLPDDSDAFTEAALNLGWIYMDVGRADRAEPLLREALSRTRERFGVRHANVADAMSILTMALTERGLYGESEQLMRDAIDIDGSAYNRPHPHAAWHLNNLAVVLALEGRLDEASALYARAIDLDATLAPAAGLSEAVSLGNLARVRLRQGLLAEAEAGFRDAIARKQKLLGDDYGDNGRSYDTASLAEVLLERGHLDEGGVLVDTALAEAQRRHRDAHPDIAFALGVAARLAAARGDPDAAVALAARAVATYAALSDQMSDKSIRTRLLFGELLQDAGRSDDARKSFQSALASARAIVPLATVLVAHAAADLARADDSLGDHATARELRAEAAATLPLTRAAPGSERANVMQLIAAVPNR